MQFPFATSYASFRDQRDRRVPGITDGEWGIIRDYQPYRRDDRGRTMRLLRQVSDLDKHRYIAPAIVSIIGFSGNVRLMGCTVHDVRRHSTGRSLYVGMKLMSMAVVPIQPEYDVQIESQMAVQPTIGSGTPLMPWIWNVRAVVQDILSRFEALI